MGRGRKPKNIPPNDPDQYVQNLTRGRVQWHPDILPALLAWLSMQEQVYCEAITELQSKAGRINPQILASTMRQLQGVRDSLGVISGELIRPWRRIDWLAAVARVQTGLDSGRREEDAAEQAEG